MPIESVAALIDALQDCRLLEGDNLRTLRNDATQFEHPKDLAKDLIGRGWLTRYQAKQALHGRGHDLVLGAYRLLEPLGEGGMGKVFKARHVPMNRLVALKIMRPELVQDVRAMKRFRREVQATARLSHPNIVTVFDAAHVGDVHFLAMEYIDGADLTDLVQNAGRLPVEAACDYVRQAALGLQHAHQRGVIHRDVKPANILVTRNQPAGVAKLLDMGLARRLPSGWNTGMTQTSLTMDGTVVGTPDFMAPEQAKNSHTVDHRADLYSLGCTFYYALTGRLPFPAGNAMEKLIKHQFEEAEPIDKIRPDVPPAVVRIVRKMMAKAPDDRFQSGAEIAAALTPFCGSTAEKKAFAAENAVQPAETTEIPIEPKVRALLPPQSPDGDGIFLFEPAEPKRRRVPRVRFRGHRPLLIGGIVGGAVLGLVTLVLAVALSGSRKSDAGHPEAEPGSARSDEKAPGSGPSVAPPASPTVPRTPEEKLAASVCDGAGFVAVVNMRQLVAAPAFEKHLLPSLQPLLQILALQQIDPRKDWEQLIVSVNVDMPDRALVVIQANAPVQALAGRLGGRGTPRTLKIDDRLSLTCHPLPDVQKGRESYVAAVADTCLAFASDPELLRAAAARFHGKSKNRSNDFVMQQLNRTRPAASLRLAILGRYALDKEALDDYGIRSFAGELTLTDATVLEGHARVSDIDTFTTRWRKFKNDLTLAGVFNPGLALPAMLIGKATTSPPVPEAGYVQVAIRSRLTPEDTDATLKPLARMLAGKPPATSADK